MIEICDNGVRNQPSRITHSRAIAKLRDQFRSQHYFRILGLLNSNFVDLVQRRIRSARWRFKLHKEVGSTELCMRDNEVLSLLDLMMNSSRLFQFLNEITDCGPIGCFPGRVYRCVPGANHHDVWHNDVYGGRVLGLSVNLSERAYTGGILEMRYADTKKLLHKIGNTGPGDAIVFRLSPELQHRVTSVSGREPKTAYAGWFTKGSTLLTRLRRHRIKN